MEHDYPHEKFDYEDYYHTEEDAGILNYLYSLEKEDTEGVTTVGVVIDSFEQRRPALWVSTEYVSLGPFIGSDDINHCPTYLSAMMALSAAAGLTANLMGCIYTFVHRKQNVHYKNLIQIFIANVLILLPLSYATASRLSSDLDYGSTLFKVMSVVFNAGKTACAWHLTILLAVCCREDIKNKQISTTSSNRLVFLVLWVVALTSAWPNGIYNTALLGVVNSHPLIGWRSFGANLYIKFDVTSHFFIPWVVPVACIVAICIRKHRKVRTRGKSPIDVSRGLKEAVALFLLYFFGWLPYTAWRITNLVADRVPGCGVPQDVLLLVGMSVSIATPVLYWILQRANQVRTPEIELGQVQLCAEAEQCTTSRGLPP